MRLAERCAVVGPCVLSLPSLLRRPSLLHLHCTIVSLSAALGVRSLGQVRGVMTGEALALISRRAWIWGGGAWTRGERGRHFGAFVSECGQSLCHRRPRVRRRHGGWPAGGGGWPAGGGGGEARGKGGGVRSLACAAPAAMLARRSRRPCAPPHGHTRHGSRCRLVSGQRMSSQRATSLVRARGRLARHSARAGLRTAESTAGCCSSPAPHGMRESSATAQRGAARRGAYAARARWWARWWAQGWARGWASG